MSHDCWNRIGVRGDRSCPELERHVHCRNCDVYATAAQTLLDRPLPVADLAERTRHFAAPKENDDPSTRSVVIFRIAAEWFALPMAVVTEVAELRVIHSLPHKSGGVVRGIANVRGELLTCVSLGRLFGVEQAPDPIAERDHAVHRRLLVIRREDVRVVCPANEVHGVHRIRAGELREVPLTVAKAAGRHSTAVLSWLGRSVGVLDDELLFYALRRSLA